MSEHLEERLSDLEEWTRKDEDVVYEKIKTLSERVTDLEKHHVRQIDENRKISRRVELMDEMIKKILKKLVEMEDRNKMGKLNKIWD